MAKNIAILAGGDGTRLKKITGPIPKPLVHFKGRPFLSTKITELKKNFHPDIFFLMIQKKQQEYYEEYLTNSNILNDCDVQLVIEEEKLGTGGAIKNMFEKTGIKKCIISNADTIINGNVSKFKGAIGNSILACSQISDGRFDVIDIDEKFYVQGFTKRKIYSASLVNSGIYRLSKCSFSRFHKKVFELEDEFFPYLIKNRDLKVMPLNFSFVDIGTPETFLEENNCD